MDCTAPGQSIIWNLAKTIWLQKSNEWPRITYGTVLGCCMTNFINEKGNKKYGANRLFGIIITESAHLIWKLRCERRIQHEDSPESPHSDIEIHNRWVAIINNRLAMDCLMSNKDRYGKKAIMPWTVLQTWEGTLHNRNSLPDNWTRQSGVLVGIRPQRPLGRNR